MFLLGAALVAAQGRITKPPVQTNSNNSGKRPHVATLRSSDSPEGSRVALSSDQSLSNYEAYRRGDRFYVKIPAADVPRAEVIRGRGFADVKTQRSGDSTVVSFRLQPGSTARVEQRANRLEVVFTVPGGNSSAATNIGREFPRLNPAESNRNANANKRSVSPTASNKNASANKNSSANTNASTNKNSAANKNSADRATNANARNASNSNLTARSGPDAALASNSGSKSGATPLPSPIPSPTAKAPTPSPSPKSSATASSSTALVSPTTQPTPVAATNQSRQDNRWSQMKERINYWILLAQLNPIPVITGALVLLLLFGLFFFQRRRAKAPRRPRSTKKSTTSKTATDAAANVKPAADPKSALDVLPVVAAGTAGVMAAASAPEAAIPEEATVVPTADPSRTDDPRRERIAQVNEEAKKLMNGGDYDQSVIGSADHETRQLVGAELLSAIVGRSAARRDNARAAFIKHGYFDDATRDLRIADSPNERAAAARRLSFVQDREATPHLVGALEDPSPDVRRAAIEALMDLRDPAAIGPLNSLMQTENDRKVPRTLIKHAIDACATGAPGEVPSDAVPSHAPEAIADPASHPTETEREVIEL